MYVKNRSKRGTFTTFILVTPTTQGHSCEQGQAGGWGPFDFDSTLHSFTEQATAPVNTGSLVLMCLKQTKLYFFFFFEAGSCSVAQARLDPLQAHYLPALAPWLLVTDMCQAFSHA